MWLNPQLPDVFLSQLGRAYMSKNIGFWLNGFFSGEHWRHKSIGETLKYSFDIDKISKLQLQAKENLLKWQQNKSNAPYTVEVQDTDWGIAALEATKTYGATYAILNTANPKHPGGAFLDRGRGHEENLWLRSSCATSLANDDIMFYPPNNRFYYSDKTRALLQANVVMTKTELKLLIETLNDDISGRYKVFINPLPQVYFRGPEQLVTNTHGNNFVTNSKLSFPFVPLDQIFHFYELRSAAPDLADKKIHWKTGNYLKQYEKDLKQRIGAQLDTLIINGVSRVLLGAWGCGYYKNNPAIVAEIYRQEIKKRASFFEHIVFPILHTSPSEIVYFEIFKERLEGLKLGSKAKMPINTIHYTP